VAKLLGTDPEAIFQAVNLLLTDEVAYRKMVGTANPYGDGHASQYIVDAIEEWYGQRRAAAS
jgi:UDP-N-acetylglucosamine 2-epimerase (non-hydrolysing)